MTLWKVYWRQCILISRSYLFVIKKRYGNYFYYYTSIFKLWFTITAPFISSGRVLHSKHTPRKWQTWFQRQFDMAWFSKILHPAPCHLVEWFWLAEEPEWPANHHAPSLACPKALVSGQGILVEGQAERKRFCHLLYVYMWFTPTPRRN